MAADVAWQGAGTLPAGVLQSAGVSASPFAWSCFGGGQACTQGPNHDVRAAS